MNDPLPDPNVEYEIVERLGVGTYGECHVVRRKTDGRLSAVKIQEIGVVDNRREIEEEYKILKKFSSHNNFPQFYGLYGRLNNEIWLVMELCGGGCITDVVKRCLEGGVCNNNKLSELVIGYILKETMMALNALHDEKIIHRDVKGHNILLTYDGGVKLIDFGISKQLQTDNEKRRTSVGTPFWMAPEVIACENQLDICYDYRADVWSLGITAIELVDGVPPFAKMGPAKALFHIPRSPSPTVQHPHLSSADLRHFISSCLKKDIEKRPTINELMNHSFVNNRSAENARQELITLIDLTGRIVHEAQPTRKAGKLLEGKTAKYAKIIDDLATAEHLSDEIIADILHDRFLNKIIYTYIGDILIAVNPNRELQLYDDHIANKYLELGGGNGEGNPPHIYAIALRSFSAMCRCGQNQTIIVSGESGSGKTESAKFLLKHLTKLGKSSGSLQDKILQLNPLLEAFGNAPTVLNENSSRFGKYLQIFFNDQRQMVGAQLSEYLLEKSRVVYQAEGEENFHVFYTLFKLVPHLVQSNSYIYLNESKDGGNNFYDISHGLRTIGFNETETKQVFRILSAILELGNVNFQPIDIKHVQACKPTSAIEKVESLLGVNNLSQLLTKSTVVAAGESIQRYHTIQDAKDVRDGLAKTIYGRLFSWIIRQCNKLLKPSVKLSTTHSIGLLDIFGFEKMPNNGFEQLLINIANEQLHNFFIQHVFAWEKMQYENEGVHPSNIQFTDNRPILDTLLSKPLGLMALIDEESRFPKADDRSLVMKLNKILKKPYFELNRTSKTKFTIFHYAGPVEYDGIGFLQKNRDYLPPDVVHGLTFSKITLLSTLFKAGLTKTGTLDVWTPASTVPSSQLSMPSTYTRTQQTTATYFRFSLTELLSQMVTGSASFVRCIKPNPTSSSAMWHQALVINQLRYTSALQTVNIRQQGFSHRIEFHQFQHNYQILLTVKKDYVTFLKKYDPKLWAIGKTKIFLKYSLALDLDKECELKNNQLRIVQSQVRRWLYKRRYVIMVGHLVRLQSLIKAYLVRKRYINRKNIIVKLQRLIKSYLITKRKRINAIVTIQKYVRMWKSRGDLIRLQMEKSIADFNITNIPPPPDFTPPSPPFELDRTVLEALDILDHATDSVDMDDVYRTILSKKAAATILAHKPQTENIYGIHQQNWDTAFNVLRIQVADLSDKSDSSTRFDYETFSDYVSTDSSTPTTTINKKKKSSNPHYVNVPPPPSSPSLKLVENRPFPGSLVNMNSIVAARKSIGNRYKIRFYPPTPPLPPPPAPPPLPVLNTNNTNNNNLYSKKVSFSNVDSVYQPVCYPVEGSNSKQEQIETDGETTLDEVLKERDLEKQETMDELFEQRQKSINVQFEKTERLSTLTISDIVHSKTVTVDADRPKSFGNKLKNKINEIISIKSPGSNTLTPKTISTPVTPPSSTPITPPLALNNPEPLIDMRSKLKKIKRKGTLRKEIKGDSRQIDFRNVLKKKSTPIK